MSNRIATQYRRTALRANFTGLTTRQRNVRIRRLAAAIDAPNPEADHARAWA